MRWTGSAPVFSNKALHLGVSREGAGALFDLQHIHSTRQKRDQHMKSMKIVTAAVIAAFTFPAFAQTTSTSRIDQRQQNQQQRIDQGVKSGQLNRKEAARLEKGQARIQKMENKATADGKVTAKERARIAKAQDREGRRIIRETHDKQTAK